MSGTISGICKTPFLNRIQKFSSPSKEIERKYIKEEKC
jgi:hypothetical protein